MAATRLYEPPIRNLLDQVETVHKKNIKEFAGGHLNENSLYKPPSQHFQGHRWKSSRVKQLPKPTRLEPLDTHSAQRRRHMQEVMYQFSLGTAGSIPLPQKNDRRAGSVDLDTDRTERSASVTSEPADISARNARNIAEQSHDGSFGPMHVSAGHTQPSLSKSSPRGKHSPRLLKSQLKTSNTLVEELTPHDLMLPSPRYPTHPSRVWLNDEPSPQTPKPTNSKSQQKDSNLHKFKHTFIPGVSSGLTMRDQLNQKLEFDYSILRKQDALEQRVLTGLRAAEHLENKLKQGLDELQYSGFGPNFHRLQVYSRTWEETIQDSSTFGPILKAVKREYDGYISHLMDRAPQHGLLFHQIQQLSARGTSDPRRLADARSNVEDLETNAKALLEVNDRLREEIRKEEEIAASAPTIEPTSRYNFRSDRVLEPGDKVNELKATILEKIDMVNAIKRDLREDFVPSTVVSQLEQCVKETDVEIQKLLKQNEYLSTDVGLLEADLTEAIETADTSDKDAKRIWRKMNAIRGISTKQRGVRGTALTGDMEGMVLTYEESEGESDEETKWQWYIS